MPAAIGIRHLKFVILWSLGHWALVIWRCDYPTAGSDAP
jgi:hypothetical protein